MGPFLVPGIANLVSPDDSFYAYFDPTSGHSMLSALDDLDTLIAEADPAYDAVLGFSHGSCLAATMLVRPRQGLGRASCPFKLAVFFSAGMSADHPSLHLDKVQMLTGIPVHSDGSRRKIDIPTAHIYAENDDLAPGQGQLLWELCDERVGRYRAVHRLGHRIPGTTERTDLDNAVIAIRQAIADAKMKAKVPGN